MNISLVLAVKNGIEMTKQAYHFFRLQYPDIFISISSGGSTDDTAKWLSSLSDNKLVYSHTDEPICFGANYNKAIFQSPTEKVVLIHNDMIPGPMFLEEINKYITQDNIVTYTTIEPPIFPGHDRPGKITKDFGRDFASIDHSSFQAFVKQILGQPEEIYDGASFFMGGYKSSFEEIGGFDEKHFIPVFREDDDILLRFKLQGKSLITYNRALVYHLVSKTIRFSKDFSANTSAIEEASDLNFTRKWNMPLHTLRSIEYWKKNIQLKFFDISYEIKNANEEILKFLEPLATSIYSDYVLSEQTIASIQKTSTFDISSKLHSINTIKNDPITVIFDALKINQEDINYITHMPIVLSNINTLGKYELGNLLINIQSLTPKQN
jgi:GT2 family glycosyltransferase